MATFSATEPLGVHGNTASGPLRDDHSSLQEKLIHALAMADVVKIIRPIYNIKAGCEN